MSASCLCADQSIDCHSRSWSGRKPRWRRERRRIPITAAVLAPMALRLSAEKGRVCHIDEGFKFLGFRIQRQLKRGTAKHYVYTWPSKKALMSITDKVRNLKRRHKHRTLADLLRRLNPVLRGRCNYFQHGVSKRTFDYLDHFTWWRVVTGMRKRHHGLAWDVFHRRFLPN